MTTNTITTKTVSTNAIKFSTASATLACTPKQISWLKTSKRLYNISFNTFVKNRQEASNMISKIQIAINDGTATKKELVKPVTTTRLEEVYYAVVMVDEVVSIKSFIGTAVTAKEKAEAKYTTNLLTFVKELESAKTFARNVIVPELSMSDELDTLTVEQLITLAKETGIKLGRATKKATIIARLLAS